MCITITVSDIYCETLLELTAELGQDPIMLPGYTGPHSDVDECLCWVDIKATAHVNNKILQNGWAIPDGFSDWILN
jgi:hypothetical protein